ncbi:formiminotransferase cyclodeaminase-like protein [Bidens hawaiensis]|uniref:formiminotransferase cyclodeaminase-like protein n=1 Tax=Bidens hawaiensis TaxID=980011 RepID=UPI00404B12FD
MLKSTLSCCKIYISETRNKSALASIVQAATIYPDVAIVNKFEDETYNRVGYTLVAKSTLTPNNNNDSSSLKHAVFSMVKAAFEAVDFDQHSGSHPRLGVVDHVCFHPLGSTCVQQVAVTAKALVKDVGSVLKVPTYTYGAAHKDQRSLDAIRRELGYFKPNAAGHHWSGGLESTVLPLEPDEGPVQVVKTKGVVVIGATKWVDNYNMPVYSNDIGTVRKIAKRVSGRGGGLASVQSMALVHDGVIEVACNLLEPSVVGGDQVQGAVERLGTEAGVTVGKGYFTDFSQDEIIKTYLKLTSA